MSRIDGNEPTPPTPPPGGPPNNGQPVGALQGRRVSKNPVQDSSTLKPSPLPDAPPTDKCQKASQSPAEEHTIVLAAFLKAIAGKNSSSQEGDGEQPATDAALPTIEHNGGGSNRR